MEETMQSQHQILPNFESVYEQYAERIRNYLRFRLYIHPKFQCVKLLSEWRGRSYLFRLVVQPPSTQFMVLPCL